MKKLLVLGLCALMTAATSAQDVMVVENKDNTTTEFNVDDIQRVYFKEKGGTEVNPSNSVLSSRLKDKDGNPVLLEGIKDAEGNWVFKFDYDSEGVLKGYQMNLARESETVIFNGLSYTGTYKRSKKTSVYETKVTLNENGLVAKLETSVKAFYETGSLAEEGTLDLYLTYNDEKQLVKYEMSNVYSIEYNEDGSVKSTIDTGPEPYHVRQFQWSNGNMVVGIEGSINYCENENVTRQPIYRQFQLGGNGHYGMVALGLWGTGSAYFATYDKNYTLNDNGNIASNGFSETYFYK